MMLATIPTTPSSSRTASRIRLVDLMASLEAVSPAEISNFTLNSSQTLACVAGNRDCLNITNGMQYNILHLLTRFHFHKLLIDIIDYLNSRDEQID